MGRRRKAFVPLVLSVSPTISTLQHVHTLHRPAPSVAGHSLSDLPHVGAKADDMTAAVLLLLDTAGCACLLALEHDCGRVVMQQLLTFST